MNTIRVYASRAAAIAASLAILALSAAPAAGQATTTPPAGPTCDIDNALPRDLSRPFLNIQSALTGDTSKAARLRAVKSVMEGASAGIATGQHMPLRNFIMAKAIFLALQVKDFPVQTTRGELGLTINPSEPVDLVVALDSLLKTVEASNPACETETHPFRFTQLFVDLLSQATSLLALDKVDSAETMALRAQLLERKSPYTWQMLASIYTRRDDSPKAIQFWQKTYDAAKDDTSVVDIKMQALYFMGEANLGLATTRPGAEGKAAAMEAAKHFRQFLVDGPKHKDAPAARANLVTALLAAGDSAAVPATYADLIANPAEYTSQDHLQAGVSASTAGRSEDAIKLFSNALLTSPYNRDALFNLSVTLFTAKKFVEMAPIAWRLVDIDPNNPDNLQMLVYAYAMTEANEPDAVKKKSYSDSLAKFSPIYERTDSSHKVQYQRFPGPDSNSTSLTGFILNKGKTERSFRLEHDFLANDGTVVGSQTVTVGPVKPDSAVAFTVKVDRGGITAWRAKPIPPPQP